MAQPYLGEIRLFASNFAPLGWALCDGQLLSISENEALCQLIGTTYGGDGQSTFALPDMRGRIPVHQGGNFILAQTGGAEEVTLALDEIPTHLHALQASPDPAGARGVSGNVMGRAPGDAYASELTPQPLSAVSVNHVGGGRPHPNLQPYLCVNYIISLSGIYPNAN